MKKVIVILITLSNIVLYSQTTETKLLSVLSICEYKNSYLISCETKELDTLYIITEKEYIKDKSNYYKLKVCVKYSFELQKRGTPTLGNFIIRIGNKVFWKTGDNPNKIPYFAKNVKDLYMSK